MSYKIILFENQDLQIKQTGRVQQKMFDSSRSLNHPWSIEEVLYILPEKYKTINGGLINFIF